jgi:glutaredoxin 3
MANVEIYTWSTCPFCARAKALLDEKGVQYSEYTIDGDEDARNRMAERANGKRTMPQIFINNQHVGGCDELYQLEVQGKLDEAIQSAAS